jgi:hypothetical protein
MVSINVVVARWHIALFIYAAMIATLLIARPSVMFTADGQPKRWSAELSDTTTPFSVMIVFPVLAFLSFYIACLVDVAFG